MVSWKAEHNEAFSYKMLFENEPFSTEGFFIKILIEIYLCATNFWHAFIQRSSDKISSVLFSQLNQWGMSRCGLGMWLD